MLDEPTNDLDLETLDLLQEVIADYDGTVLIVSHDRDFLDRTVTITLGLDGSGKVDIVAGGYEDWVEAAISRTAASPAKAEAQRGARRQRSGPPACAGDSKLSYKDQRDLDRLPQRDRAARARDRRGRGGAARPRPLSRATRSASPTLTERDRQPRAEKDAAEHRWLEVAEMAEQLGRASPAPASP